MSSWLSGRPRSSGRRGGRADHGAAHDSAAREALRRAADRLDRLRLYPRPVRLDGVRLVTLPLFFELPRLRRYDGYAFRKTIVLRRPPGRGASDDLICHELCHIWQTQHRPLAVFWAWLTKPYAENPYELEARRAVAATRGET